MSEACLATVDWDGPLVTLDPLKIEEVLHHPSSPLPDPNLNMDSSCSACPPHTAIGDPPLHVVAGTDQFQCGPCGDRQVAMGRVCQDCAPNQFANWAADTCECCPAGQIMSDAGANTCDLCALGFGSNSTSDALGVVTCGDACIQCPADVTEEAVKLAGDCPAVLTYSSASTQADSLVCPDVWVGLQALAAISAKPALEISATAIGAASMDEATCTATTVGYDL